MVNENWRWQPWYREMKQLLERDTIGRVWHASVRMRTGDGRGETPYLRQPYFKEMPRFLLYETGVHFIDTLRYLISEISCVQALTRRINPVIAGEDLALVLLEFESGASGLLDANRYSDPESSTVTFGRMVLEGEKGSVVLEETGVIMVKLNGKAPRRHVYALPQGLWGDCCHATQSHFVNALLTGGPFETDGRGYLRTFAAVEAAYEAAALHKAVSLD